MTDVPNCSTCSHRKPAKPGYYQKMNYCEISEFHFIYPITCSDNTMWMLQKMGCLFHTQAGEYLMQDVLMELERRLNSKQNQYNAMFAYSRSLHISLEEAISLIRNGVKK